MFSFLILISFFHEESLQCYTISRAKIRFAEPKQPREILRNLYQLFCPISKTNNMTQHAVLRVPTISSVNRKGRKYEQIIKGRLPMLSAVDRQS